MSWKTFIQNALLILIMAACGIAASYIGMLAAIDHLDEQRVEAWSVARGER